jgi:hypothetical protein
MRLVVLLTLIGGLSAMAYTDNAGPEGTTPAKPNRSASAGATATPNPSSSQRPGTSTPASNDADATRALDRMGAYLRTLKAFQVHAVTSRDEVLENGQKVTFTGAVNLLVSRPDRFRAEVASDRQQREYLYDGKSFTLWAQRVNYYATVPAPPTLGQLGAELRDKYDIEVPLADLFQWGSEGNTAAAGITAATDIGPSEVEGVSCEHFALRQDGVDWQVWIQQGDFALPRKLILTTTTDEARPEYSSVLTWNLAPSFNDAAFTFNPPPGAQKITFAQTSGSTGR